MHLSSIDFFYRSFANEQMNFLYTGDFSDGHTDGFIELNNHQYNAANEYKRLQRKAGFLIAECFQNIVRHNEPSNKDSYFHIKNSNGVFSIVSGNRVSNEIIPSLKEQLIQLNKLTSQELKEVYRRTLSEGQFSEKGGAGLGLIEMARRSKNKLDFSFKEIDDKNCYFYFRLHLNIADSAENQIKDELLYSVELKNKMIDENLFFIYKGVISIQTTIVILDIIEKSIKTLSQKVVFVKFMGLFEKIKSFNNNSKLLVIGEDENKYSIGASCFLKNTEAIRIDRILSRYTKLDSEALDLEYKRVFNEENINIDNSLNLEIIEILKNCFNFEFEFRSQSDDITYINMVLQFQKKRKKGINQIETESLVNQVPSEV
jgi:hypothetical protein